MERANELQEVINNFNPINFSIMNLKIDKENNKITFEFRHFYFNKEFGVIEIDISKAKEKEYYPLIQAKIQKFKHVRED